MLYDAASLEIDVAYRLRYDTLHHGLLDDLVFVFTTTTCICIWPALVLWIHTPSTPILAWSPKACGIQLLLWVRLQNKDTLRNAVPKLQCPAWFCTPRHCWGGKRRPTTAQPRIKKLASQAHRPPAPQRAVALEGNLTSCYAHSCQMLLESHV